MTPKTIKPVVATEAKSAAHSPCTLAVAACRLAAIAAIAETSRFVALAYVQEANAQFERATELAADDAKDKKQVNTAFRWTVAAKAAADSLSR